MRIFPMPDSKRSIYEKGLAGEAMAERYLCSMGFQSIACRYRSPYGEIDLIMLDKDALVFIEVKSRSRNTLAAAEMAVSPAKQRRIIQTALCYLNEHPEHQNRVMRFDIVSLAGDDCIEHLPNAFQGCGW